MAKTSTILMTHSDLVHTVPPNCTITSILMATNMYLCSELKSVHVQFSWEHWKGRPLIALALPLLLSKPWQLAGHHLVWTLTLQHQKDLVVMWLTALQQGAPQRG